MLKVDLGVLPLVELNKLFAPIEKETGVGIAVSGGKDSLALLLLIHAWQIQVYGELAIRVYTLDHGLRPEAKKETLFVKEIAQQLGFRATILRWDGIKPKSGIQAAARAARYRLIGQAMKQDGAAILLTGHHKKDQAETVLMRLAHSSGLKGLGGMHSFAQVEGTTLFRPLLDMEPEFLKQVVTKSGLVPLEDPSNDDDNYERVRWRKHMPSLERLGLDSAALSLFARRAQRANLALDMLANSQFDLLVSRDMFGVLHIDLAALNAQPEEIALRLVKKMLECIAKKPMELAQLEIVQNDLKSALFATKTLKGCVLTVQKGTLLVFRELAHIGLEPVKLAPGNTIVWDQRFEIHNSGSGDLSVQAGGGLTRATVEKFVGNAVDLPMNCVKSAPLVKDINQEILALGTLSRTDSVSTRRWNAPKEANHDNLCPNEGTNA